MRTLQLNPKLSDEQVEALSGQLLGEESYDLIVNEECTAYKEDGSVLFILKKKAVSAAAARQAYMVLREAATPTSNRGTATGKKTLAYRGKGGKRIRKDGSVSNTVAVPGEYSVNSGIIGYFDRYPRFPYCRQTAFTMHQQDKFIKALPFIQEINKVFEHEMPERYAAQKKVVGLTQPEWVIPDTVFTTVTVNKNWQTAVHKDVGDLKEGFGVMAILRAGNYNGCYFVFPKYRVAVDYYSSDVLLADVHEWHGNTPLEGNGLYERITLVLYYREKMLECGTPTQELDRAKKLRGTMDFNEAEGFVVSTLTK